MVEALDAMDVAKAEKHLVEQKIIVLNAELNQARWAKIEKSRNLQDTKDSAKRKGDELKVKEEDLKVKYSKIVELLNENASVFV